MKSLKLLLAVCTAFCVLLNACKKDAVKQDPLNSQILTLKNLGYRTDDIVVKADYYIVEGDIMIKKDAGIFKGAGATMPNLQASATHKIKIDQAVTDYKVAQTTVNVYIDGSIPSDGSVDDWRNAIALAVSYWNAIPNSRLYFVLTSTSSNADIIVQSDNDYLPTDVIAAAMPPNSSSQPGNLLFINLDYLNKNIPEAQKSYNIVHELGHNVGLRHTNWATRGEAAYGSGSIGPYSFYVSGANLINGTRNGADLGSVMNGGTAENTWNGFSEFDILAVRTVYPLNTGQVPIYRYVFNNASHFYTTTWSEIGLGTNPRYEGPSGYIYNYSASGTVPFYRFYNSNSHDHFYSTSPTVAGGYNLEGTMGYVYITQVGGTIPLYRFFNTTNGHFYTINPFEYPSGYTYEGVACYVLR